MRRSMWRFRTRNEGGEDNQSPCAQVCNHPLITYPPDGYASTMLRNWAEADGRIVGECGKMQHVDRLVVKLSRTGHRVLLFSTMTKVLDLMEAYLRWRTIDGACARVLHAASAGAPLTAHVAHAVLIRVAVRDTHSAARAQASGCSSGASTAAARWRTASARSRTSTRPAATSLSSSSPSAPRAAASTCRRAAPPPRVSCSAHGRQQLPVHAARAPNFAKRKNNFSI